MSNMLEQAIADAAALREQAIKNAEQSVIEKYSHQIKEAVDQMLETDGDPVAKVDEVISEVEEELKRHPPLSMVGNKEPQSRHPLLGILATMI
jgi:F0F1-type ATP synthase membrane subunit b/b'